MNKIIYTFILTIASAFSFAQTDLTNGLIACYPFDGDATDATNNANNGFVQGATLTSDRFGNNNSAYLFDGIDDFIQVDGAIISKNENSISFWSKTNSFKSQIIISSSPDILSDRLSIAINYKHLGDTAIFWDHGDISGNGRLSSFPLPELITQWEHYVFVASVSSDSMWIYRNGILHSTADYSEMIQDTTRVTLFGSGDNSLFFDGAMDDIKFYNRAINASEAALLYQSTTCLLQTSIPNITQNAGDIIQVYPNPTNGLINISEGYESLKIYNIMGEIIASYSKSERVDISAFTPGIYLFQIDENYRKVIKK